MEAQLLQRCRAAGQDRRRGRARPDRPARGPASCGLRHQSDRVRPLPAGRPGGPAGHRARRHRRVGLAGGHHHHAPAKTKETAGLFDADRLARVKDGVVIVNAARGGLIVESALVDALESGRVRAAALDVFDTEPCTDSPLFELENTVVTPHLGASTGEAQDRAGTDVARSVLLALRGEFVPDAVNVSGGPVGDEVAPWLDLVRKVGLMAGHMCPGVPTAVRVDVAGELSSESTDVLGLAALRGMFS